MEVIITEKALNYLKKLKISGILIQLIPGETNAGWGCGSTRMYYTPSIVLKFPHEKLSPSSYIEVENKFGFKIYVQLSKLSLFTEKEIIIDLDSFLFIKRLVLKNLDIIFV